MNLNEKKKKLESILAETGGVAVAFSGGVDSTFLSAVAHDVLGERAIAVTALSPTYPEWEQNEAVKLAKEIGIRHIVVDSNELEIDGFAQNPVNRCYFCKKELFEVVGNIAGQHGINSVADGTNRDDESDYRPGRKAAKECGVISPLYDAGMGKDEIRELSRQMGLPTHAKPAFACLASRFPYGDEITAEKLRAVDSVELYLRERGYSQFRVRHHGQVARIEVLESEITRILDDKKNIVATAKAAGFQYVTVDLEGYRTGSMNETLDEDVKQGT